ncbi:PREDICTED: uncharacterized protein LOC104590746 [Nelumbo nucifera]|uniref:Uncharacterized protein LOC104590746 n=1 Tax=Nelumbo nucifera TaxID=4432 RepID=A0A1U7ZJ70_NELNU|nr:PREDICTED: uncharacterized protein LOC104590746 [Nelumbo nucifera]
MALPESAQEENEKEEVEEERCQSPACHPCAPSSELFDISTTVDPSYIISLIRKLIPHDVSNRNIPHGINERKSFVQESGTGSIEESSMPRSGFLNSPKNGTDVMDIGIDFDGIDNRNEGDETSSHNSEQPGESAGEEAWEEYGCILWDLAAHRTHAEFMVENLLLEVLLATLTVSKSARVTEISLGIIGNLACHEVPRKHIISMKGLVETIVDQLFLDDSQCLCETCRLLTLGLRGSGAVTWAGALHPEHILCRILWIAENTLNPQLLEKTLELLSAILNDQQEVTQILLQPLMELNLPALLINLLAFEVNRLTGERTPDRYSVIETILRTIEALSAADNYSQVVSSNKELFRLVYGLVTLPDKAEIASSCVTAVVLVANILTDAPSLTSEISQDISFLQGLLEILPFVSDDPEARSALWSVLARILSEVQEDEMSPTTLHSYVLNLVDHLDFIEEDLIDHQSEDLAGDDKRLTTVLKTNMTKSLSRVQSILNRWTTTKGDVSRENSIRDDHVDERKINKLLHFCHKYITRV